MASLAQLRRDLKVGSKLVLIEAPKMPNHKFSNVSRLIVKVQTNGVYLALEANGDRGSFLELPRASLVEYDGETIKTYECGQRELTEGEQKLLANAPSKRPENQETLKNDLLSNGNTMFWADQRYFAENDAKYLDGFGTVGGLRYNYNSGKVYDETIKGDLSLAYRIIKS